MTGEAAITAQARLQHVVFLDGMRGAAALYVLLFHLAAALPRPQLPPWAHALTQPLMHGHLAVGVFIVLSGYLLMLPPARSDAFALRGGVKGFMVRRGRRILPPYYAALFLSLPFEAFRLRYLHNQPLTAAAESFVSHLFLLHNFRPEWAGTINGPLWSVAVECQIYLVFALLLLPLIRRFGIGVGFVCAWIIGLLPTLLLAPPHDFSWSCPWYVGLFALGMAGAVITQRGKSLGWTEKASRLPWGIIALIFFIAAVYRGASYPFDYVLRDIFIGTAALGVIVAGVLASENPAQVPLTKTARWGGQMITRLFGSPLMVGLGAFSYSLYLIHFPLLAAFDTVFKHFHASPTAFFVFQFLVVLPCVVFLAYGFYRVFEKPFIGAQATLPIVPRLKP